MVLKRVYYIERSSYLIIYYHKVSSQYDVGYPTSRSGIDSDTIYNDLAKLYRYCPF